MRVVSLTPRLLYLQLSLCLTKHHALKTYAGVGIQLDASLTLESDESEWSASRLGRFTPRWRAPVTHWIGGWVDPRAGLEAVVRRKISSPYRDSNPSTVQPVAHRCTTELYEKKVADGVNFPSVLFNFAECLMAEQGKWSVLWSFNLQTPWI
jgi:hypothetical protein